MNILPDISEEHLLIQRLKTGQEDAVEELYVRYGNGIYNIAYRMTGSHEDAQDIMQETILRVYRHIAEFRGDSRLYTWIYAIANNMCLHILERRKKNSFMAMQNLIKQASEASKPETISDREKQTLIGQIKDGCFSGLLRCLSFNQRMAFILYVLLHIPITDTASVLAKSEGATKVLIHRARQNLKNFLCEHCSLYDNKNPCRCENLLSFSLSKSWISCDSGDVANDAYSISPAGIEAEVSNLHSVVALYQSLREQKSLVSFRQYIKACIKNEDWAIFSRKKV